MRRKGVLVQFEKYGNLSTIVDLSITTKACVICVLKPFACVNYAYLSISYSHPNSYKAKMVFKQLSNKLV